LRSCLLAPAIAAGWLATGCATFHGPRPVSPGIDETVTTLRPTLRWEPASESGVTYDLEIAERPSEATLHKEGSAFSSYVEGLTEPRYECVQPLEAGRTYLWAVRLRRGGEVSDWSSYDEKQTYVLWTTTTFHKAYRFQTSATASR
jgi:hypothetical protein